MRTVFAHLMKMLTRRGELIAEKGQIYRAEPDADIEEVRTLRPLQAASVTCRIAFSLRAGHKVLSLRVRNAGESTVRLPLCADVHGFSLHARRGSKQTTAIDCNSSVAGSSGPALSDERVRLNAGRQVGLKLKSSWRDATTHLVMSPLWFMQRLAALAPWPRSHLIRLHGVLAPHASRTRWWCRRVRSRTTS